MQKLGARIDAPNNMCVRLCEFREAPNYLTSNDVGKTYGKFLFTWYYSNVLATTSHAHAQLMHGVTLILRCVPKRIFSHSLGTEGSKPHGP
jgi:hypothetical protein